MNPLLTPRLVVVTVPKRDSQTAVEVGNKLFLARLTECRMVRNSDKLIEVYFTSILQVPGAFPSPTRHWTPASWFPRFTRLTLVPTVLRRTGAWQRVPHAKGVKVVWARSLFLTARRIAVTLPDGRATWGSTAAQVHCYERCEAGPVVGCFDYLLSGLHCHLVPEDAGDMVVPRTERHDLVVEVPQYTCEVAQVIVHHFIVFLVLGSVHVERHRRWR
mmetsp:Transcript_8106/g.15172  ORF Transcript_8106/g.15172 Transcript_8106/m.15172 type:complete len:217 (-) Transcript_8106:1853-2503(-)